MWLQWSPSGPEFQWKRLGTSCLERHGGRVMEGVLRCPYVDLSLSCEGACLMYLVRLSAPSLKRYQQ